MSVFSHDTCVEQLPLLIGRIRDGHLSRIVLPEDSETIVPYTAYGDEAEQKHLSHARAHAHMSKRC